MNSLELTIRKLELNEVAVMNALQGQTNLISDNCMNAADVAPKDCFRACQWVIELAEKLQ